MQNAPLGAFCNKLTNFGLLFEWPLQTGFTVCRKPYFQCQILAYALISIARHAWANLYIIEPIRPIPVCASRNQKKPCLDNIIASTYFTRFSLVFEAEQVGLLLTSRKSPKQNFSRWIPFWKLAFLVRWPIFISYMKYTRYLQTHSCRIYDISCQFGLIFFILKGAITHIPLWPLKLLSILWPDFILNMKVKCSYSNKIKHIIVLAN